MKFYLVGGAVRDRLLGLPVRDRDWVVVGGSEDEMLEMGFTRAAVDFPVFVHPETGDEYALARRETKVAPGYKGFTVEAGPEVTLEQDLVRRDLTINALAEDGRGEIVDLFNGRQDLQDGMLRHISPAFVEDPVRLLRVARFAARLGRWGFRVSHATHRLMQQMVRSEELASLSWERVWMEMKQALAEEQPWRFFEVLWRTGALETLIPELNGVMTGAPPHAGGSDCAAIAALKRVVTAGSSPKVRFAVVMYHAAAAMDDPARFMDRLRVEREFADLLGLVVTQGAGYRRLAAGDPEGVLTLIERSRGLQQPARFDDFLTACGALWPRAASQRRMLLQTACEAVRKITAGSLQQQGLSGTELGCALRQARLEAIARAGTLPNE